MILMTNAESRNRAGDENTMRRNAPVGHLLQPAMARRNREANA